MTDLQVSIYTRWGDLVAKEDYLDVYECDIRSGWPLDWAQEALLDAADEYGYLPDELTYRIRRVDS